MKKLLLCSILTALCFLQKAQAQSGNTTPLPAAYMPIDSANVMIQSYLNSVEGDSSSILSLIADADALRNLLADSSIMQLKLMFAHTQAYVDRGHQDKPTKCTTGDLTMILVGVNINGDYVYGAGSSIINRLRPCPYYCPLGTAGNSLLE